MKPDCHECANSHTHTDCLTRARVMVCSQYNIVATPKTSQDCTEFVPRDDVQAEPL